MPAEVKKGSPVILSKKFPYLSKEALEGAVKKCQEIGATGVIPELVDPYGYPKVIFHFIKQPDYESFEEIKECYNPAADIFLWSENLVSLFSVECL